MSKLTSFLKVAGCIALLCFFVPIRIGDPDGDIEVKFNDYLETFNKSYSNKTEYHFRLTAFKNSLKAIEQFNMNRTSNESALHGLTEFSDLTPKEFEEMYLSSKMGKQVVGRQFGSEASVEDSNSASNEIHKRSADDLPLKVDWRQNGTITKIKNQGQCGACWAFCVVENLEAMVAMKTNKLEEFSVQELIDCAGYGNEGCNGGDMCTLLKWMSEKKVKVVREKEYPLKLVNDQCRIKANQTGFEVLAYTCENVVDQEDFVLEALAKVGPVAAAVNAILWQNYVGGVIQYNCDGSIELLNHAVQIVGYDLTAEIPHYIVRNSWGPQFGDNGYLYIAIGKNLCGIANEVSTLLNVS